MKIESIVATSDDKAEAYRLLVMIHAMAIRCSGAKVDGWSVKSTCTDSDYVSTVVTNGIVDVEAVTVDGRHTYSMRQVESDDE